MPCNSTYEALAGAGCHVAAYESVVPSMNAASQSKAASCTELVNGVKRLS